MKLKTIIPALLIAMFFTLIASSPAFAFPVTVTDDYGFETQIQNEPQKIVSLSPTGTEILFALDLGDKIVGNTDYCYYPEEAKNKTKVGGYTTISVEKITSLNPDLIIATGLNGEENVNHLRQLGFKVIVIDQNTIADVYKSIDTVGKASGKDAEAAALIKDMQNKIASITDKLKNVEKRPTVMHAMDVDPFWISGNNTFQNELIALAGGQNAFADVESWATITLEKLIVVNPDIILTDPGADMINTGKNTLRDSFFEDGRLASISAVKNNDVYVVDSDIFDRGGPRLVLALENVAKIIHPEIFGEYEDKQTAKTPFPAFAGIAAVLFAALLVGRRK